MTTDRAAEARGDVVPALVLVAVAAVAMSVTVHELSGKWWLLALIGVAAVAGAELWVGRAVARPGTVVAPASLPAPSGPAAATVGAAAAPATRGAVALPTLTPTSLAGVESLSLPKEGSSDADNEDAAAIAADKGVIAVSDGASSSFASNVWSRSLVAAAISQEGALDHDFVSSVVATAAAGWAQHHSSVDVPWWAQEGLRRGAYATLLVVRIGADGRRWQAIAVGDSCLFHLRRQPEGWVLVDAFPVSDAGEFGSHPDLLGSVDNEVRGLRVREGALAPGDVLLAATDAVSEWLLRDARRIPFAAEAHTDAIAAQVHAARVANEMVNDDATFVRYRA